MNYILFKADGSLNKQKLDYYIQQSSTGVNTIFVSIADSIDTDVCQAVFTLPNETQNTVQGIAGSLEIEGVTYTGWNITLTSDQTLYNGLLQMSVRIIRGSTQILANYPVALVINETGIMPDTDTGVTIQEINSYLVFLANLQAQIAGSDKYLKVVDDIANINTTTYEGYLNGGDVVYCKTNHNFYLLSGTYPSLTAAAINLELDDTVFKGEVRIVEGTTYLTFGENGLTCLQDYLDAKQDNIPVVALNNLSGTISSSLLSSLAAFPSYLTYEYGGDKSAFIHVRTDGTYYYFRKLFKESIHDNTTYLIYGGDIYIQVNKSTGVYSQQAVQYTWYSKAEADSTFYNKSQIDTMLTSMLVYKGSKSVAQLNGTAGSGNVDYSTLKVGDFYNVSDSGQISWTISGTTYTLDVLQGDNICWTGSGWDKLTMDLSVYDDKFIAAGFFEVQDYNDNTGEITMVYSSDLYDMSYDGTSGVLTIEAN